MCLLSEIIFDNSHPLLGEDGSDGENDADHQVHHLVADVPTQHDEGEEKDIWSVRKVVIKTSFININPVNLTG